MAYLDGYCTEYPRAWCHIRNKLRPEVEKFKEATPYSDEEYLNEIFAIHAFANDLFHKQKDVWIGLDIPKFQLSKLVAYYTGFLTLILCLVRLTTLTHYSEETILDPSRIKLSNCVQFALLAVCIFLDNSLVETLPELLLFCMLGISIFTYKDVIVAGLKVIYYEYL